MLFHGKGMNMMSGTQFKSPWIFPGWVAQLIGAPSTPKSGG